MYEVAVCLKARFLKWIYPLANTWVFNQTCWNSSLVVVLNCYIASCLEKKMLIKKSHLTELTLKLPVSVLWAGGLPCSWNVLFQTLTPFCTSLKVREFNSDFFKEDSVSGLWEACILNRVLSDICSHSAFPTPSWGFAGNFRNCVWTLLACNTSALIYIGNMPIFGDIFIAIQYFSVRTVIIVSMRWISIIVGCFFWILW